MAWHRCRFLPVGSAQHLIFLAGPWRSIQNKAMQQCSFSNTKKDSMYQMDREILLNYFNKCKCLSHYFIIDMPSLLIFFPIKSVWWNKLSIIFPKLHNILKNNYLIISFSLCIVLSVTLWDFYVEDSVLNISEQLKFLWDLMVWVQWGQACWVTWVSHASKLFLLCEGVLLWAAVRIYIELSLDLCVWENGIKSLTFGNIERLIIQIE